MRIVTVGRGHIGSGLAGLWTQAGHDVIQLGRDGGDASLADLVLVAVPGPAIGSALAAVRGLHGKVTIDATNSYGQRSRHFPSQAHEIKSITGGPTAKSFNTNWATIYDQISRQKERPGNLYAADPAAAEITEQLVRDAGFEPIFVGDLEQARMLEDHVALIQAVASAGLGPFFYRMSAPPTAPAG
ncbi:MAG: dinucleotide-binding protein [Actinomycetota bacterium]|nr:dinucleotide-binding protein [Actinomycetota bacterium]